MYGNDLQLALPATIIKFGAMDLFRDFSMASTPFFC